jgi:hypothetical protein
MYEVIYSHDSGIRICKCETKSKAVEKVKEFKQLIKSTGYGSSYVKSFNKDLKVIKILVYKPREN